MRNPQDIIIDFQKIFVMGYPHGWYDKLNNIPITKIGHFSTPFDIDFNGQPFMLGNVETQSPFDIDDGQPYIFGDIETHSGMSGGPVFVWLDYYITRSGSVSAGTLKIILVGIHSGKPIILNRKKVFVKLL